jgi:2-polyprenyl-3-methyl-5-hydroxy-6-metoxy-1,4-benzoquinol methylase
MMDFTGDPASAAMLSPEGREVAGRFTRFRTPMNAGFYDALAEHKRHLWNHPCLTLHFEYAVTTNQRGRDAVNRLSRHLRVRRLFGRRTRMLDVGCAYGGFLVAFAEKGARVTGIEIDERLLRLAVINLRENGIDGELIRGDATAEHPEFRGRFDIITANDVVEHVPRLDSFLKNLRAWLSPRGACYLEIPNGDFPGFVLKDGHHELFGITQLDFDQANRYLGLLTPGGRYDTYNYLTLATYRSAFAECGLSLTVLPETLGEADVEWVDRQVGSLKAGLETGLATVPVELRELVRERVEAYLARVEAAPRTTEAQRAQFLLDYGASFWVTLAKPVR